MPSSGATSAGFCPSTSVCHSTVCQRSGSEANARGGGGVLEALDGGVAERDARVERLEVVGGVQPGAGADLVDVQPAYGGEQVGAEREVGAAAALEHRQHLRERLGDEVVGVGRGHELAGQSPGGVDVAAEQLAVGVGVAPADGRDQLGVAGVAEAGERGAHTGSTSEKQKDHANRVMSPRRRPFPRRTTDQGGVGVGFFAMRARAGCSRPSRGTGGTVRGPAGGTAASVRGGGGGPCLGDGLRRCVRRRG